MPYLDTAVPRTAVPRHRSAGRTGRGSRPGRRRLGAPPHVIDERDRGDGVEPGRVQGAQRGHVAGRRRDLSRRRPRRRASSATLASSARPMPAPAQRRGHHDRVDLARAPVEHSPMNPTTPCSSWSATHRPERLSWVRYSSNPAPVSAGQPWVAVEPAPVLGQLGPQAAAGVVVGRPVRADSDPDDCVGRTVSVIRSCLLLYRRPRQPNDAAAMRMPWSCDRGGGVSRWIWRTCGPTRSTCRRSSPTSGSGRRRSAAARSARPAG